MTTHPDRFDAIVARVADIRERSPEAWITLKPLRVGFGSELYDYSPRQLEQLARGRAAQGNAAADPAAGDHDGGIARRLRAAARANEFILAGSNRWRGYLCEAGAESLRVKGSGEVLRAVCGAGGVLGRLGEDFALPGRADRVRPRAVQLRGGHPDHQAAAPRGGVAAGPARPAGVARDLGAPRRSRRRGGGGNASLVIRLFPVRFAAELGY